MNEVVKPSGRVMIVCAFVWALAWSGCATGELGGEEGTSCSSDDECPGAFLCNRQTGDCFSPTGGDDAGAGPADTGGGPVDTGGGPADTGGEPDAPIEPPEDTGGGEPDTPIDPNACTPGCAFDESCVEGQCVPDNVPCNPACEAPGFCVNGACEYPACAAEGDLCDGNMSDQGAFHCLTNLDEQRSRCFAKCDNLYEPSSCGPGQYCLDPVSNAPDIQVCLDSSCATDADCADGGQTGTCVELSNGFGTCYRDGAVGVGGACDLSDAARRCVGGAVCQTGGSGSAGTCRATCDPWASRSDCNAGERCVIFSARTGVCAPVADATGAASGDTCTTPGNYCADGVACFPTTAQSLCYQYCRPDQAGQGDCPGSTSICNDYVFPGDRELGICLLRCESDQICGGGGRCVDNRCRQVCQTGDPVVDCCDGTTPCNWTCGASGLCE